MIALIRYFVQRRRIKAGFPVAPVAFAPVNFTDLPRLQYDVETFDPSIEETHLQDYLNAKAKTGWRLHTIAPVVRAGYTAYFLTWDRLSREGIKYADYGTEEGREEEARA